MDPPHPLKALLQLQLASDSHAVLHLPYVLASLTSACFTPSPHTQKWATRINSLLQSKDPGARWAGLCIAHRTSVFSKSIMIEYAHSWLGVALHMLSRNESAPTLKASMCLLTHIFRSATDVPEFQRQLATPNVPKFSIALIALAQKQDDREVKLLSLAVLAWLIPLYPTLHRAQHTVLQSLALKFLNGSVPTPTDADLLKAASRLYSVLHFTGGKVGAANLWRKSLDETLAFTRNALLNIRSTFYIEGHGPALNQPGPLTEDPAIWIPLNIDRLRCGVIILCDLMRSTTHRPIHLPVGHLVSITTELLRCTPEGQIDGHVDSVVRAMELSALPAIWRYGCDLLACLAQCARHHLTSSQTRLITYIIYHLEQPITASERLPFLDAIQTTLSCCQPFYSTLLPTRLAKSILPSLTMVLATQSEVQRTDDPVGVSSAGKNKKGKKRARGYEGDEVFKVTREVICPTRQDGDVLMAALHGMILNWCNVVIKPHLAAAVHSIASRVLLSMLLVLPQIPPPSLSPDTTLHGRVLAQVHEICVELGSSTSTMSKSLGLVIRAGVIDGSGHTLTSGEDVHRRLDLLLHPRVPPLVRSLPHVESLSLFLAEESLEEIDVRETLGLDVADQYPKVSSYTSDIAMTLDVVEPMTIQPPPTQAEHTAESNQPPAIVQPTPQPKATQTILPSLLSLPSKEQVSTASSSTASVTVQLADVIGPMDESEEDEEIPAIDLDSDSD